VCVCVCVCVPAVHAVWTAPRAVFDKISISLRHSHGSTRSPVSERMNDRRCQVWTALIESANNSARTCLLLLHARYYSRIAGDNTSDTSRRCSAIFDTTPATFDERHRDAVLSFSNCYSFLARDVIYTSRAYAMMPVRLSVRLSVTEVHWRIIANLGFKFRSHFTAHCGCRAAAAAVLLAGDVLLAVLLAGESSRAMLASARLSCYFRRPGEHIAAFLATAPKKVFK